MKKIITTFIYLYLLTFACNLFGQQTESEELFPIRQNGKWGYINRSGKIVIEPQFTNISSKNYKFNPGWSEGLAPVRFHNEAWGWGYIDKTGKVVIKPQFSQAERFSDGLARIHNNAVGYINKAGEMVIPPKYCYKGEFGDFTEGLAYVEIILGCFEFSPSTIDRRTEYGYINKTGEMVISKLGYGWFSEGLAPVQIDDKYGYIDKTGKIVIEPKFESALNFVESLAFVQINKKDVYIDTKGKIVINPPRGYSLACCDYSEGLAKIVTKDRKYGYIDKTGKIAIKPQFDGAEMFSEGLAAVNLGADKTYSGGKWGYIDKIGKIVIDFKFGHAEPFHGGLALVGNTFLGTIGYIDKTGKYIWEPTE